jgi:signal transduction histidine kinase
MLIEDVLDLAKVEAGRMEVGREPRRVHPALDAALAIAAPLAGEMSVAIENGCADDPPYVGDEDRVRQILVNLLSNAAKFTPAGGAIHISCGQGTVPEGTTLLHPGTPWTFIRVRDTGIGIAPEDLDRVFQPFVQAEAGLTRTRGGTGLGLTISRELARLMGGDLTLTSRLGAGSTFTLWLPGGTGEDPATSPPAPRS